MSKFLAIDLLSRPLLGCYLKFLEVAAFKARQNIIPLVSYDAMPPCGSCVG